MAGAERRLRSRDLNGVTHMLAQLRGISCQMIRGPRFVGQCVIVGGSAEATAYFGLRVFGAAGLARRGSRTWARRALTRGALRRHTQRAEQE